MSVAYDVTDLSLSALTLLLTERVSALVVSNGWIGNQPLPPLGSGKTARLSLEIVDAPRAYSPGELVSISEIATEGQPTATALIDYGSTRITVRGNLYVEGGLEKKAVIRQLMRLIERVFVPEPGQSPGIVIVLKDPEQTRAKIDLTDIRQVDDAEGLRENEWRAIMEFEVRAALRHQVDLPICTTIQLGDGDTDPAPISQMTD